MDRERRRLTSGSRQNACGWRRPPVAAFASCLASFASDIDRDSPQTPPNMGASGSQPVNPGWRILLIDAGLDPARVLKRADLPGDLFARDKASVTIEEYFRLWRAIEEEAADPPSHSESVPGCRWKRSTRRSSLRSVARISTPHSRACLNTSDSSRRRHCTSRRQTQRPPSASSGSMRPKSHRRSWWRPSSSSSHSSRVSVHGHGSRRSPCALRIHPNQRTGTRSTSA